MTLFVQLMLRNQEVASKWYPLFFFFSFPKRYQVEEVIPIDNGKSVEKQCERSKFNFLILLLQEKNKVCLS